METKKYNFLAALLANNMQWAFTSEGSAISESQVSDQCS